MFSFWSNDEEENSDNSNESDHGKGKNCKPERFLYVGNGKRGERIRGESPNPMTGHVFQNNYNAKEFNERKKKMDDMLQDVWSVRKDVRVNTNTVKATDVGTKSFYSRHARGAGPGVHNNLENGKNASSDKGGIPLTKTWSVPRTNYSYSDDTNVNQYDILGDNSAPDVIHSSVPPSNNSKDVQRQNIVNSLKHGMARGPNVTNRELSARTRRAQKFNNAYLRSTGLGKYMPGLAKPPGQHHKDRDQNWNR